VITVDELSFFKLSDKVSMTSLKSSPQVKLLFFLWLHGTSLQIRRPKFEV